MSAGSLNALRADLIPWTLGPVHPDLPGPLVLRLWSDGEIVRRAEAESGYAFRGLERACEKHPWGNLLIYADRVDPEGAAFYELAMAMAIEELNEIEVPKRAQEIRLILCELNRVGCHLGFLARMARAAGSETIFHYVLRDREKVLDLFELLTGSRFSFNFLRFGGTTKDVTEGFLERVVELCELMRVRLKEYNDLFSFNEALTRRIAGVGVITPELARTVCLTGPNARASGLNVDLRKARPYSGYEKLDFEIASGQGRAGLLGDCHDRLLVRLYEINQSLEMLRQLAHGMSSGEFLNEKYASVPFNFRSRRGEGYQRIESARGEIGCYVVSDAEEHPARVQFKPASAASLDLLPDLLPGVTVEDVPLILASLDLSMSEVDK